MVKKREQPVQPNFDTEKLEKFVSGADGGEQVKEPPVELDRNAVRTFKATKVPFNEFEYQMLEYLATKTGRSKLNAIRWAVVEKAEELKRQEKKLEGD